MFGITQAVRARQLVLTALVMVALQGCAQSPIAVAETAGQKAYAAYGTLVISEERVGKITAPGSTIPRDVQLSLISIAERADPVATAGLATLERYEAAKTDFEAKRIDGPALAVVVNSLESWYAQAQALVGQFAAAFKGAR